MTEAFTVIDDKKIIHYLDSAADDITLCGISNNNLKQVKIHYRDRYHNRICKTCFKTYITHQRIEPEPESENEG